MRFFSDKELMLKLKEGDIAALGELYLRYQESVFALAYRTVGEWNSAKDITQETFLLIQRNAVKYRPKAEFTTWLYRIVINLCLNDRRRYRRLLNIQEKIIYNNHIKEVLKAPSHNNTETLNELWYALMKLNERQRKAVILHKLQGLSHKEISARTGWTQSSVESLLVRAYKNLRKELINTQGI